MATSDQPKSFLDRFMEKLNEPEASDTEAVVLAKGYLEKLGLTREDRSQLAGWLVGQVIAESVSRVFEDQPPTE